ncbi:hypothetical protein D3C84_817880 [compost metagenome]
MHDVVGEVVLAVGDEDLLAVNPVDAVSLGLRAAAHGGQVRTGLGLGQVHGAGPFATDHVRQVGFLEVVRTTQFDSLDGPTGEHGAQTEGEVGGVPHFLDQCRDQAGQALAAELGIAGQGIPATRHELLVGLTPTAGGRHFAIVPACAFPVAGDVEGREDAVGEAASFTEDGFSEVEAQVFVTG